MAADIDHARIVDRLATTHERRMLNILQQLEDRVAAYAMQAPTQDGRLFDLAWSLRARSDIQQIIRETYLTEADAIIREYDQVFDSINEMFERYESFVGVSPEVVSNLKRVSFQGFRILRSRSQMTSPMSYIRMRLSVGRLMSQLRTCGKKSTGYTFSLIRQKYSDWLILRTQGEKMRMKQSGNFIKIMPQIVQATICEGMRDKWYMTRSCNSTHRSMSRQGKKLGRLNGSILAR